MKKARVLISTGMLIFLVFGHYFVVDRLPNSAGATDAVAPMTKGVSPRLIVELTSPPLAEWAAEIEPGAPVAAMARETLWRPGGRLALEATAAAQYEQRLAAEQTAFLAQLARRVPEAAPASYVDERGQRLPLAFRVVFNGVVIDAGSPSRANAIRSQVAALPGVQAVHPDLPHEPTLYASLPLIGAPQVWSEASIGGRQAAGRGVKIASLDGGLHHAAPMFNGQGFRYPPGFPKGDIRNTNGKIIVSRAYFRDWDPPIQSDADSWPGGYSTSHGLHTASTAAGVTVEANYYGVTETLSGVAPGAYLMSYRVFYPSVSGIGSMFSAEGIAALEDIVRDGADIVNNSWGAGPFSKGGPGDALDQALVNAWRAGVFVTMSQGNAGPNPGTGDHPSADYINVANTTTSGMFWIGYVEVTAPTPVPESLQRSRFASASFGRQLLPGESFGPSPYLPAAAVDEANAEGCQAWPEGTFAGKVALIRRGSCEFGRKALHAEQAGASFVIIYNHAAGGEDLVAMAPGEVGNEVTIGAVFVGHSAGEALVSWYTEQVDTALAVRNLAMQIGTVPDVVDAGSSRGPAVGDRLKPDIAAPGSNILAQGYGPGEGEAVHMGFGEASGTSMAAPHVSGAAALVRQAHPRWPNSWIKSALMSTARYTDVYRHDGSPAQPLDIGAGRLEVARALDPGVILEPPSLSFGRVITGAAPSITLTITSVSDEVETYTLDTVYTGDGFTETVPVAGLQTSIDSIRLAPGEQATVVVTWRTSLARGTGDNQGYLTLTSSRHAVHLPAWVRVVEPPVGLRVLLIDNDGSSLPPEVLASAGVDEPFVDYVGAYTRCLEAEGYAYDVWDADARSGFNQATLPSIATLTRYPLVLYQTGDNYLADADTPGFYSPPTDVDMMRLVEYVNGGGRLLAFGQDFSSVLGVPGSSPWLYGVTLGAQFVQDSVTGGVVLTQTHQIVTGLPDTPFANFSLDLSALGDGAGNQAFVDEIVPASGVDALMKYALPGTVREGGIVAIASRDNPTLERPVTSWPGRSMHLAFGLEGVNEDTGFVGRGGLFNLAAGWLLDEPEATIRAQVRPVGDVSYFTPTLRSAEGGQLVAQRWDFGDGSPFTDLADVGGSPAGHTYRRPGSYLVRAELHDTYGTVIVAQRPIQVPAGATPSRLDLYLPWAGREAYLKP